MHPFASSYARSVALTAGAAFALFCGQFWLNIQLRFLDGAWVEPPISQDEKWNPELFKTLTFGQLPTAIDILWIRSLADPAYAHVLPGQHPRAYYDLDLATDLDPAFFELYNLGSYILTIIRNDNEGARDILLKGRAFHQQVLPSYPAGFQERYWSRAWSLYITLAYVYMFELQDVPNAARIFREAADIAGSPTYLQSLKSRLEQVGGEYEVALRVINYMIETAPDEASRERLTVKRNSLFLAQYLFMLNERFREFAHRDPRYRAAVTPPRALIEAIWAAFRREQRISDRDPWGGTISLSPAGKVVSTTPHERVFGLE